MKSLISPWESVFIDDGFGHAGFGVEEENKKVLWGPFAILDCGDEFMTQQLIQEWLQNTDEFTIDIRTSLMEIKNFGSGFRIETIDSCPNSNQFLKMEY